MRLQYFRLSHLAHEFADADCQPLIVY